MLVDRNASSVIATLRLVDGAKNPIDSVAYNDASLTVHRKKPTDTDWVDVTGDLVDGTLGSYLSASWKAYATSPQDGTYQFCPPDDWVVAGKSTLIRVKHSSNPWQYDAVEASGSVATANEESIANLVLAGISAIRAQLLGVVDNGTSTDLTLTQTTDWNSGDGHAIEFDIVDAGVDFTSSTAAFGTSLIDGEALTATASIVDPAIGSCKIRLEFTDVDLDHPKGTYQFNAVVVQADGDRLPGARGSITLAEDYTV